MSDIILTQSQQRAYDKIKQFVEHPHSRVFILKGYAGTGKTTLMKTVIEELNKANKPYKLLASTGRAAKILSNKTGTQASTVHSEIYQFGDLNQDLDKLTKEREQSEVDKTGQLLLNFNLSFAEQTDGTQCVYIVDESSMISDKEDKNATQAIFGSGRLLRDLLDYDNNGKFIFVGDYCQLPPITQKISPALSADYFNTAFHIAANEAELTDIVRQAEGNDIVLSAQRVRKMYFNPQPWKWAKFPFKGFKNVHILNSQTEMYSKYIQEIKTNGYNYSTILCYSNRQCNSLTSIIRPALGINDSRIAVHDLLLITQNNYISGLMNGDLVEIVEIGKRTMRANLTFIDVTVKELFSKKTYSQFLIEEILYGNQTNLAQSDQKELLIDFYYRMKDKGIKQDSNAFKNNMLTDPYLNAIRAVYGYALTCHKAQGGEWQHVYLDIPRNLPSIEKPYVYQWIYTAITRASQELYVVDDFWVI